MRPAHPPRTLYRRVYMHGVLLLVMVAMTLAFAGFFLGRDVRWRFHPTRLAQHVAGMVSLIPDDVLPSVLPRLADEFGADLAIYTDDGHRVFIAGEAVPPSLEPEQAALLHRDPRALGEGRLLAAAATGPGRYLRLSLKRTEGAVLLRVLGSLTLVVLMIALASAPLARAIALPIEHLSRVAQRLGEGDLAARASLTRSDEIGALAATFDQMAERLGRLLEGQRELLANVSHELRTPLARIRVALSLAAEAEPQQASRHLHEIERDVVELERLVADLLTATRLDGGGSLVLRRERIDPRGLIDEATDRFRRHYPGRTLTARLEAAPAVDGEPALLARVLDNLLDNAAKYSEEATPVALELAAGNGGVTIAVRDQGIGIPPEDLPRVFTPFFRGDRSRRRDTGGIGLGLVLSKRIVEAHGGRIAVDSSPSKGTTVTMWLSASSGVPPEGPTAAMDGPG
ncbi:MAG TPA: HAMP domain-containing sensor histidine kinase [Vicinamibacteria bacterium]|nr:HAMP domain-containing sensor histidine kinase [Vicinamibacteria bacterium]